MKQSLDIILPSWIIEPAPISQESPISQLVRIQLGPMQVWVPIKTFGENPENTAQITTKNLPPERTYQSQQKKQY
jgi:hypothetical protein